MLNKWLKETYKPIIIDGKESVHLEVRPRIVCKDGFSMSVQAGHFLYCLPRRSQKDGYIKVEVGYPSEEEPLLYDYAEGDDYTQTVYGYVPVELVEKVIEKHGGMAE